MNKDQERFLTSTMKADRIIISRPGHLDEAYVAEAQFADLAMAYSMVADENEKLISRDRMLTDLHVAVVAREHAEWESTAETTANERISSLLGEIDRKYGLSINGA